MNKTTFLFLSLSILAAQAQADGFNYDCKKFEDLKTMTEMGQHRLLDQCLKERSADSENTLSRAEMHLLLITAVRNNNSSVIETLAAHKAPINAVGNSGHVLQLAQNTYIKKLLHKLGADINGPDATGNSAIHYAANLGQIENVETLLTMGADINLQNNDGQTPLIAAIFGYESEAAKALLALGANPETKDNNGFPPIYYAAETGQVSVVQELKDRGVKRIEFGNAAVTMMEAMHLKKLDLLEALLMAGADVNVNDQVTVGPNIILRPIELALSKLDFEAAKILMSYGASHSNTLYGMTTPEYLGKKYPEHAKKFLDYRAIDAIHAGNFEQLKALENDESNPLALFIQDEWGNSPLYWASYSGQLGMVRYLVAKKLGLNTPNVDLETPLIGAARRGHVEVVRFLLEQSDIRPGLEDDHGRTALTWAEENEYPEVAELLRSRL